VRAKILLRIASIVSLLFAAGHTLGATQSWSPAGETEVLRAMRSFRFDVDGVSRTYWDFYVGFGFIISIYLLLQSVLLWQVAAISTTEPLRARPLIGSFLLAALVTAFVSAKFIFAIPVVFSGAVAACLGLAFLAVGRRTTP
jgi:hypothetical protein